MTAYYNEIDQKAAIWLRNLIEAGHIAPGIVDTRSIEDVSPGDLAGFTQCHFFAGIGVWSYALRKAGWPDDKPVWTGSCPCQPFSTAGEGAGFTDQRHLWPAFHWLVEQCRPTVVLGEQVAGKAAEPWLDLVQVDLEALGYAFGAVAFPAASVGAPHIRDRIYWMADACCTGLQKRQRVTGISGSASISEPRQAAERNGICEPGSVVDAGQTNGFWGGADWLGCRDGRYRPVEPGTFPLSNGASARVVKLRAYGNAIVAPQAVEFISAYLDLGSGE